MRQILYVGVASRCVSARPHLTASSSTTRNNVPPDAASDTHGSRHARRQVRPARRAAAPVRAACATREHSLLPLAVPSTCVRLLQSAGEAVECESDSEAQLQQQSQPQAQGPRESVDSRIALQTRGATASAPSRVQSALREVRSSRRPRAVR